MSLSASTLILFVLLIPGIVFRFFLYSETPVRRSLNATNTLYVSIMVVLYAIFVQVVSMLSYNSLTRLAVWADWFDLVVKITEKNRSVFFEVRGIKTDYFGFLEEFSFIALLYSVLTLIVAYLAAKFVIFIAQRWAPLGKVMYGPLAPLMSSAHDELLVGYVLTKVSENSRRIMYQGFVAEVILGNGSNIDHIVLKDPSKFYLNFSDSNHPKSSIENAKSISTSKYTGSLLYIAGEEIENTHFEAWLF